MKTTVITALSLLFLLAGYHHGTAQQTQTLFENGVTHGGFGGPVVKFSDIRGVLGVWVGGRGGWIVSFDPNHSLSLGAGGYGLVTEHKIPNQGFGNNQREQFAMNGYGGFEIEYTNRSWQLVHMSLSSLIGAGGLMIRDRGFHEVDNHADTFFVFEPGVNLEVNITHFFRIAAGIHYKLTSGIRRAGFSDDDFSGLNGTIQLKFGKFL